MFTFAQPVQAFGAYFSGIQLAGETITFSDGTSQTIPIPTVTSGIAFVGFTDAGKSITSITVNVPDDIIGVDDARFVATAAAPVPEPATLAVFGVMAAGAFGLRRRVRNAPTA